MRQCRNSRLRRSERRRYVSRTDAAAWSASRRQPERARRFRSNPADVMTSVTRLEGISRLTRHVAGALAAKISADAGRRSSASRRMEQCGPRFRTPTGCCGSLRDGTATSFEAPRQSGLGDIAVNANGVVDLRDHRQQDRPPHRRTDRGIRRTDPHAGLPPSPWCRTALRGSRSYARTGRLAVEMITEFELPRPTHARFGITVDGANNVWYADLSGWVGRLHADRAGSALAADPTVATIRRMAPYTFTASPSPGNSYKAALMLSLCDADWEPRFVDFFNGETGTPDLRAGQLHGRGPGPRVSATARAVGRDPRLPRRDPREVAATRRNAARSSAESCGTTTSSSYIAKRPAPPSVREDRRDAGHRFLRGRSQGLARHPLPEPRQAAFAVGWSLTIADFRCVATSTGPTVEA